MEFQVKLVLFCILLLHSTSAQVRSVRARSSSRIVGGQDANAGQFRFAAAIQVTTSTARFFCGGALVHYQWILTAGHCVDGAVLFVVTLGTNNLNEENENTLTLATSTYFLHPDFNNQTLANDIGVIELRMPVQWTPWIEAIYLPFRALPENHPVTTLGWGQKTDGTKANKLFKYYVTQLLCKLLSREVENEKSSKSVLRNTGTAKNFQMQIQCCVLDDGEFSEQLQFISVTAITNEECRMTYGSYVTDGVVCIAGNYNEGTCIGDSGSPLIEYNNNSYTTWHAGIASFVSANGCESMDPSGFTRSQYYLSWLQTIMK